MRVAQPLVGWLLFAVVVVVAARQWSDVRHTIGHLSPLALALSVALAVAGLFASSLTWRALLGELGSHISRHAAARIYLIGQLGKYLPGSVWAFVIQMELGRRAGVRRSRTLASAFAAVGVNLVVGLTIGLLAVAPIAAGSWATWVSVLVILPLGVVAVLPPVLTREINLLLRIVRRPQLERPISWRGVGIAGSWSVVGWLTYGLALWVLVVSSHDASWEGLALCLGVVPLAMTAGFIVVVAPSGIGVREAALVAGLAPILPAGRALAIALVLRFVFTEADVLAAALTLVPLRATDVPPLLHRLRLRDDGGSSPRRIPRQRGTSR